MRLTHNEQVFGDGVDPWLPRNPKPAFHAAEAIQTHLGGRQLLRRVVAPNLFAIGPPAQCPTCLPPDPSDVFVLEFGGSSKTATHAFAVWLGILWPADDTLAKCSFVVDMPVATCFDVHTHLGESAFCVLFSLSRSLSLFLSLSEYLFVKTREPRGRTVLRGMC